jgi:hypothetical protein
MARDASNLTNAGKGRVKGVPNKTTTELKEMILAALDKAGGVDYLLARASDEKTASAFLTLIGKVLPLQVNADTKHSGSLEITWHKPGES